jgi:hypothetical protein
MAQGIPDYEELKLRIQPGPGGGYGVLAFAADGSTAQGTFTKPFSDAELDNFILRVGLPRRSVRAFRSSQMEEAKRFGSELFDALVCGDVREVYLGARRASDAHHRGLRVTLYLTGVPELMEIPWEFLYERRSFLSQSVYTPLVRSLDLKDVRPPVKVGLPIRVLGMVSRPSGFDNLDVDAERGKLETALRPAIDAGLVELQWLSAATLSELERTLGAPGQVHVFHYIGHGAYDQRIEGGILVLENRHGQPHEVTGEELGALLQDERSLRLAVLNSGEGARTSHVDPFSGVASSLVHYGVPAVIGMQFEITDDAAITFADRLYTAVAQGFPVDAALAQARKAIFAAGNDVEFGTPVLFLRAADARLFDVDVDAAAPRAAPIAAPPPAKVAERRFEPAGDRPLRPDELGKAGGFGFKKERATLTKLLEAGERVYRVCAGNRGHTGGDPGLAAVTDRRLLFAMKDGNWEEWAFSVIARATVDTSVLRGKLELRLIDGSTRTLAFLFDASAAAEIARLLEEAGGRVSPASAASTLAHPHVELVQRTNRVRRLRIEFGRESHLLTYTAGVLRDKLELDDQVLVYAFLENAKGFDFTLGDGDRTLPARVKVALNSTGQVIQDITLVIDGRLVYSERPG